MHYAPCTVHYASDAQYAQCTVSTMHQMHLKPLQLKSPSCSTRSLFSAQISLSFLCSEQSALKAWIPLSLCSEQCNVNVDELKVQVSQLCLLLCSSVPFSLLSATFTLLSATKMLWKRKHLFPTFTTLPWFPWLWIPHSVLHCCWYLFHIAQAWLCLTSI